MDALLSRERSARHDEGPFPPRPRTQPHAPRHSPKHQLQDFGRSFAVARSHPRVRRNELFGGNGIATIAAFGTYFAMYAFRKPFTAAAFAEPGWFANNRPRPNS